jgi:hypothetical protein
LYVDSSACEQGLIGALDVLPRAEERRREIDARRVRSDRDLVHLFRDPWRPPIAGEVYAARQRSLAAAFGADDLLPATAGAGMTRGEERSACA